MEPPVHHLYTFYRDYKNASGLPKMGEIGLIYPLIFIQLPLMNLSGMIRAQAIAVNGSSDSVTKRTN